MSARDRFAQKMNPLSLGMKVQPFLSHLIILLSLSDNEEIWPCFIVKAIKTVKIMNAYGDLVVFEQYLVHLLDYFNRHIDKRC